MRNDNSPGWLTYVVGPTVVLTYILMVMGNVVTTTGSGLACPDWPLCYGSVTPPAKMDIWFEWGHRLLGGASGIFILLSTILVWKYYKGIPRILTATVITLLVAAVLFGGLIVITESPLLNEVMHVVIVSSHLVISTIVFICLIFTFRYVSKKQVVLNDTNFPFLLGALYILVLIGIVVRYSGATLSCPDLPLCNGKLVPSFTDSGVVLHFLHRLMAVTVFSISLYMLIKALREGRGFVKELVTFVLIMLQATFGILIVYTSMFFPFIVLHGATAFFLLGWVSYHAMPYMFREVAEGQV